MSETSEILNAKEQLALANKLLGRIAALCTGALDPELTREQVVGRLKYIYTLAAFDDDSLEDLLESGVPPNVAAGLSEGP